MNTVRLSKKARRDYERIAYSYFQYSPQAALDWHDHLTHTFSLFVDNPQMGRSYEVFGKGVRRLNTRKEAVYYIVRKKEVFVKRIIPQSVDLRHL